MNDLRFNYSFFYLSKILDILEHKENLETDMKSCLLGSVLLLLVLNSVDADDPNRLPTKCESKTIINLNALNASCILE